MDSSQSGKDQTRFRCSSLSRVFHHSFDVQVHLLLLLSMLLTLSCVNPVSVGLLFAWCLFVQMPQWQVGICPVRHPPTHQPQPISPWPGALPSTLSTRPSQSSITSPIQVRSNLDACPLYTISYWDWCFIVCAIIPKFTWARRKSGNLVSVCLWLQVTDRPTDSMITRRAHNRFPFLLCLTTFLLEWS